MSLLLEGKGFALGRRRRRRHHRDKKTSF